MPVMAVQGGNSKAKLGFLALASLGLLLALTRCERPILDYLDEYKVLDFRTDQNTGKVVELGALFNFGSTEYEVGVYDEVDLERSKFALRQQNISIVGNPGPVPQSVQFDGDCYFVVSEFRNDWGKVRPMWRDDTSGKEICFYVLTPGGKRIPGNSPG